MSSLTTRNQLQGTVTGVMTGSVMAEVKVDVGGNEFVAVITKHSVERLDLKEGDEVTVLVKATEVMLAKGSTTYEELSTRNQIAGKISRLELGSVMGEAVIGVGDNEIVAAITRHSVERLGLAEGDDVVVLVKATEVMLAK
jgi:molybdate transport system regulatory protein